MLINLRGIQKYMMMFSLHVRLRNIFGTLRKFGTQMYEVVGIGDHEMSRPQEDALLVK